MKNKMLFALILVGLLNQSSFLISSDTTTIINKFPRPPVSVPPLSERQKKEIAEKNQIKQNAVDSLLGHYDCLSERQKSMESIPTVHPLVSDNSLEGFNKEKAVLSSPKTETSINSTMVQFNPKTDHPCESVQQLSTNIHDLDTFLIESTTSNKKPHYLLTENQVKTLIDIFAKIPQCTTIFVTMSLPNDSHQTTSAKTFSLAKSVLTSEHRLLTVSATSDQEMITNFFQQFELLTNNGKNTELIPPTSTNPEPEAESPDQKKRRLAIEAVSKEAKKILFKVDQPSTAVTPEPSISPSTFSFYRSPLFVAGVCSIAALAIAAFYYPRADQFIEFFKDFFKNSVSPNLDSSLE